MRRREALKAAVASRNWALGPTGRLAVERPSFVSWLVHVGVRSVDLLQVPQLMSRLIVRHREGLIEEEPPRISENAVVVNIDSSGLRSERSFDLDEDLLDDERLDERRLESLTNLCIVGAPDASEVLLDLGRRGLEQPGADLESLRHDIARQALAGQFVGDVIVLDAGCLPLGSIRFELVEQGAEFLLGPCRLVERPIRGFLPIREDFS
jgi:hypothetical protein